MKKIMKNNFSYIIALTILFLFSACGGNETNPLIVTTMSVKVVTKEGTAIPNAKVLAAGKEVITNDKGVYSFKITHQGSFTIAAFAEGYKTSSENITEKTSRTLEKEIRLAGIDKSKPLIVTTMSGKVVTKEGTAIPNAKVLAAGKEVITNATGAYSLEITHQGSFTIAAFAEGYKTSFENITQNTSRALEKEIKLDFAYKVKITGKVTGPDDKPIADAEVQALMGKAEKLVVKTKADGTYEFLLNCASPLLSAKKCGYCVSIGIGITKAQLAKAKRTVTRNFKLTKSGCEVVTCR